MKNDKLKLILLAASVFFVNGCAHSGQRVAGTDACSIFPKSEAENLLGVKLQAVTSQALGENARQSMITNCLYSAAAPSTVKSVSFTVRAGSVEASASNPAENHIIAMKQQFGQRYELQRVPDLGNGAVWDQSLRQLTVFQGVNTYAFVVPGSDAPDLEGKLVELARKTIPRT